MKRRSVTITAFLLVAMLSLSACFSYGHRFDYAAVGRFAPGITTRGDAVQALGEPNAMSVNPDGTTLLQWQDMRASALGATSAHAAILFDKNGTMMRVVLMQHN